MKIRWRYGIAFPLILAVVLGGLASWLGRISHIETEETALNPNEPQYLMNGIAAKRFDEHGLPREMLNARQARQFPNSRDVHLDMAELDLFQQGQPAYRVEGSRAVYQLDQKTVVFNEGVVLTKQADADKPAGRFTTATLSVDTQTETARTDAPVQFEYGKSHGTAQGMTYQHQQGLLTFPSKVKATIYDVKNP